MFTKFVKEHKKSIHQLFNLMWETTEYIRKQLAEQGYSVGPLVHGIENYILIDGKFEPAHYPTPEFGFPCGVVGCILDGLYFVMAIEVSSISAEFLKEIIKEFPQIQIYGGKDFTRNFYPPPSQEEVIFQDIKSSGEETIQLEIIISELWDESKKASVQLISGIEELIRIARSHKIKIVNPLQSPRYRVKRYCRDNWGTSS